MLSDHLWVVCIAFLVAANASLLGTFLMLRRASMLCDALSHAVLPGIVGAFLLTGTLHQGVMMAGAAVAGVLASLLISWLSQQRLIEAEVAIGITFTTFFALGLLLVCRYTRKTDLDLSCVLYGKLLLISLDEWVWHGYVLGPKAAWWLGGLLLMNATFVGLCYPRLLLSSFDAEQALLLGMPVAAWHYALMTLTSVTTVLALKSVGAVLVVGLMVAAPAIAYVGGATMPALLWWALLLDALIALLGYGLALLLEGSVSGAMMVAAGGLFALAWALSWWGQRRGIGSAASSSHSEKP